MATNIDYQLRRILAEYERVLDYPDLKIDSEACQNFAKNAEIFISMMMVKPNSCGGQNCRSDVEIRDLISKYAQGCTFYRIELSEKALLEFLDKVRKTANALLESTSELDSTSANAPSSPAPSPAPTVTSVVGASAVSPSPAPAPAPRAK